MTFSPTNLFSKFFALRWFGFLLFSLLLAAGCVAPVAVGPTPTPAALGPTSLGPTPPAGPERMGGGLEGAQTISDIPAAMACLASGQPVYGIMQRNANVRSQPELDGCRVGRAATGTLVRIEGIYDQNDGLPLTLLQQAGQSASPLPIGYVEDVQPIFQSTCNSCHGDTVQNADLKVTEFEPLMAGSQRGSVIVPGDPEASFLWQQISQGIMPLVGVLTPAQKETIRGWIAAGAPEHRPQVPPRNQLWMQINPVDFRAASNDCGVEETALQPFVNSSLVRVTSCAVPPTAAELAALRPQPVAASPSADESDIDNSAADGGDSAEAVQPATGGGVEAAAVPVEAAAPVAHSTYRPGQVGIAANPLGLAPPADTDPWMVPQGGFCVEQRLPRLEKNWGITSLAFAPDGRLFLGLDAPSNVEPDPNILFDAFHPSRAIAVYNSRNDGGFSQILTQSSRVTGMTYYNGALYISRAGEVGRIVDGGGYERLAAGFAVNGRLFHANDGIAIQDGWLYISAGGVRDGYSDGIIAPESSDPPAETVAVNIVGGGNPYAARIVRAQLSRLLSERNIKVFQTAARGVRNPYGLTTDPSGRLWFTDNGATNFPGEYGAGDEINLLDPRTLSAAAAAGDESATPFYGFPIVLSGKSLDWYTSPVLQLYNTAAPTGITWAYNTIFFAQYGHDPGLYRLANAGGQFVAERVLLSWPIQAVTTAPDGAIWIGTGYGGLYRLTPGCN